tara:strand:+ start:3084 stop:4145 length:1062 start_codon:yes stop_codon:yes gene_type:complete
MSEFFVQKSKTEFIEYAIGLGELISERFPECTETKECIKTLRSMDGNALDEALNHWMIHLSTPLTKKVKYAKAVERIIKSATTVMHALKYHDMDGIETHIKSELSTKLDIFSKFKDDKITDDDKKVVWKFLEKIAASAHEAKEKTIPTIPTRQDIQDNIRTRKKETTEDGPPSMQRAFVTHINALCKTWGQSTVLEDDDAKIKSWMTRWSLFAQKEANGVKNSARLAEKDPTVIDDMRTDFPELHIPTDIVLEDGVWVNFSQLTSFSTVVDAIPTGMMGRIEDMANKLADDIVSGKTDMASVNLNDIGQQVLSQCNEGEMDKFAGNINNLLPALQAFQTQMPSNISIPMPPNV